MKLVIFFFMLEVIRIGLKFHYCPLALSVNAYMMKKGGFSWDCRPHLLMQFKHNYWTLYDHLP